MFNTSLWKLNHVIAKQFEEYMLLFFIFVKSINFSIISHFTQLCINFKESIWYHVKYDKLKGLQIGEQFQFE